MTGSDPVVGPGPRADAPAAQTRWLQSPSHDVAVAFAWVPFAVAAHAVSGDPGHLRWLVSATLLLSFAHQPLTLWLVYGDGETRRAHRALFIWGPPAFALAVSVGATLRPEVVAVVAGGWNLGHTLRQRYGLSRLYGRLGGINCGSDNRLLWSWLSLSVIAALATTDLSGTARDVGLGSNGTTAVDALGILRGATIVALPAAAAFAAVQTTRAVRAELVRPAHSVPRLTYLGSSALLLVVLAAAPVTGFVAYVGGHAVEYLLVVRWRIGRAAPRAVAGDHVASLARRIGRNGTMALYAAMVAALILAIRATNESDAVAVGVLTIGALHLAYDGVIWRSPPPPRR